MTNIRLVSNFFIINENYCFFNSYNLKILKGEYCIAGNSGEVFCLFIAFIKNFGELLTIAQPTKFD